MSKTIQTSLAIMSLLFSHLSLSEPLFFRAVKEDKELLILGSIHMGTEDMYPLPDEVMNFLKESDALITEIKLSEAMPKEESPAKITRDVLNADQKLKLEQINEQLGLNPKAFLLSPAWQTAITLQISQFSKMGFSQELGIDSYITDQAIMLNKAILGLESVSFQLDLFTQDPNTSELLLIDTVDNWGEHRKLSECLAKAWQAGNSKQLSELAMESEIDDELSEQFIYQRNRNWAEKLDSTSFLSGGKYLVVVGALHLVGKDNLVELLAQKGFDVEKRSQEEQIDCI